MSYAQARLAESLGEIRSLGVEIDKWRSLWDVNDALGAHLTQLDLLVGVLQGLVNEIASRAAGIDPGGDTGTVYEACRRADLQLLHARRLWRWYADKLDQRAGGPDAVPRVRALRAADELTWSCWKTALTAFGGLSAAALPAAPIPYLAPQFSAFATPRTDPPPDLRPGADELLRRHIELLPVPVIGLPPACARRPWWLIIAAHEVSHHVQFELPGLEDRTQDAVVAAALTASGDAELAEDWRPWCRELFADACAVLLVGPAALWAIAELEMRPAAGLRRSPSGSYPPPLVRLAVARQVAVQAGFPAGSQVFSRDLPAEQPPAPGPADPRRPAGVAGAPDWAGRLLGCARAVAGALLGLEAGAGRGLRVLGTATARAYDDGIVAGWRKELLGDGEPVGEQSLDAARIVAAAAVDAWQRAGKEGSTAAGLAAPGPAGDGWASAAARLAGRVLAVLPECAEPGTRAAGGAPDAARLAWQILADLDAKAGAG
jgi:hypothetical protein